MATPATMLDSANEALSPLITSDGALFTVFPMLPIEMRRKIWNHAIADIEPRIVTLAPKSGKVPALLHACGGSRNEVKMVFSSHLSLRVGLGQRVGFDALPLVNYDTDTVYLKEMKYGQEVGSNPLSYAITCYEWFLWPITKLALRLGQFSLSDFFLNRRSSENYIWYMLAVNCPNIEELVFDWQGLIYYGPDGSLTMAGLQVEEYFQDCLSCSLLQVQNGGEWEELRVYMTTAMDTDRNKWICFSKGRQDA